MPASTNNWKLLAAQHRQKQRGAIPSEWLLSESQLHDLRGAGGTNEGKLIASRAVQRSGLLSAKELEITENFTASELLAKLSRQEVTSEEVVRAFSKRAGLAQQLTCCLTEIMFNEGLERARELDQHLQSTGKVAGPLHGLPISLKDSNVVKGHYATVGYVEFLRQPVPDSNSALVQLLLDAGAVLYCKTNIPQTMMTADSENNIFGRTLNPHNTSLTAGGSTGGEGALVSFRGSPLGVGSDIAGSIRIPAACCGVYGLRPTADRVPFAGQSLYPLPMVSLPGVAPVSGPLGHSVDDLALFMKTTLNQRPWKYDSAAVDVPWRELDEAPEAPLVIGILPEDPDYPLHPPVRRQLEKAISVLEKKGHKIVHLPADPESSAGQASRIAFQYFSMVGPDPDTISREVGEPLVASVARATHPFSNGNFPVSPHLEVPQRMSDLNGVRHKFSKAWQQIWIENELDVVLSPPAATTAVPHDTFGIPVYTLLWNVLDYPAGVIPFGTVSKFEDSEYERSQIPFEPDYNPEVLHGAPCSIQVAAPRFRDEECLRAMKIIDQVLRAASK
ncbi:hypothetical protein F66182_10843 [Fusarium sp. NRRL 66182]|nr:hypothetical protein F66182_10843 [Fusarium sp. NRRL 66182]